MLDVLSIEPWEHLAMMGVGAYLGHKVADNYDKDVDEVGALRAILGKSEERK